MLRGVLTHVFKHAQHAARDNAASDAAGLPGDLAFHASFLQTNQSQSDFSYHAFFGADLCHPADWEKFWGVILSSLFIIYGCLVLTRICDQYLIPSLEVTAKKWGLSEDVAGVTLLAFGGSFPEMAIHMIATLEGSEIGLGTVVGSAVFNVTVGVAAVSFLTPLPVVLLAGPLIRDTLVYIFCLSFVLILFNWNARVVWWQATTMVVLYVLFVIGLILRYQQVTQTGIFSPEVASPRNEQEQLGAEAAIDSVSVGSAVLVVSEEAGAVQPSSPEEMAHGRRLSISHRKKHAPVTDGDSDTEDEQASLLARPSSAAPPEIDSPNEHARQRHPALHDYSDQANPDLLHRFYYGINRPTDALARRLIPTCSSPGRTKYYRRSFAVSLFVVLLISFVLMCLVQYWGCVSGIDRAISGLLVLGVAASLPDIISVGVSARRGLGVMAVSGLVGSNVFDILVGLGLPWLLHMGIYGGHVQLASDKVYTGAIVAVVAVLVFGVSLILNGMRLQKHVAWLPLIMYVIYVVLVVQKMAAPPEEPAI